MEPTNNAQNTGRREKITSPQNPSIISTSKVKNTDLAQALANLPIGDAKADTSTAAISQVQQELSAGGAIEPSIDSNSVSA